MYGPREVEHDPVVPPALCTLAKVKTALGISGTDKDTTLNELMIAAAIAIETHCGQPIAERDVTERIQSMDAASAVVLRHAPATALSSVMRKDTALTPSDFRLSARYATLRRVGGSAFEPGEWVFVYKAGYASGVVPSAVATAAVMMTAHLYNTSIGASVSAAISKESAPDVGSTEYAALEERFIDRNGSALPADIALMLLPYVREF